MNDFGCEKCMQNVQDKQQQIRAGARKWKQLAMAAEEKLRETEERCVELMQEKMRTSDGYLLALDKLDDAQHRLNDAEIARHELELELLRVKAHAYDLAFGCAEE